MDLNYIYKDIHRIANEFFEGNDTKIYSNYD